MPKPKIHRFLDAKDRKILTLVQRDGKLSQAEVAKRVGLSTAAVHERLRKLESSGVIRRFAAMVDPKALGAEVTAFVEVFIEHPRHEAAFIQHMRETDEVLECHHVTGEFSLLLKVRVQDVAGLQRLLLEDINRLEGVRQTRTLLVLSTQKEETFVSTATAGDAP